MHISENGPGDDPFIPKHESEILVQECRVFWGFVAKVVQVALGVFIGMLAFTQWATPILNLFAK